MSIIVFMQHKIGDVVNIKITDNFNHFKITGSLTIPFEDLSKYIATNLYEPHATARILKATFDDYNDYIDEDDEDDSASLIQTSSKSHNRNNYKTNNYTGWCCWKRTKYITLHFISLKCQKCIRKIFIVPYGEQMYTTWVDGSQNVDAAIAFNDYFSKVKTDCNGNSSNMHNVFSRDHFAVVSDCYVEVANKQYVMLQHSKIICSGSYYDILEKVNNTDL